MVIETVIFLICLIALIVASITDIKTREVPDWLSFSLMFSGLGLRLIYSVITSDWMFIVHGLFGFIAFLAIAYIMFYAGQWGGGDSKILIGLGGLLGLELNIDAFIIGFWINVLLVGVAYGLLWSVFMAIRKRSAFLKEFRSSLTKKRMVLFRRIFFVASVILIITFVFISELFIRLTSLFFAILFLLGIYVYTFIKAVEASCMLKHVEPEQLTEGDWIAEDIIIGKKRITGPKDLGIEMDQIKELIALKKLGKVKKVLIKEGIPFVPSFLIAFILTYVYGNLILLFLT